MVKVKKRSGKVEEFMKSKIARGCQKAGATASEAARVAEEVARGVATMTVVSAERLAGMVVKSLNRVNKTAGRAFTGYRKKKRR